MSGFIEDLGWSAIDATVLAAAVAAGSWLFRAGAPLRFALWLLVLVQLILPPIGAHPLGLGAGCRAAAGFLGAALSPGTDLSVGAARQDLPAERGGREPAGGEAWMEENDPALFVDAEEECGSAGASPSGAGASPSAAAVSPSRTGVLPSPDVPQAEEEAARLAGVAAEPPGGTSPPRDFIVVLLGIWLGGVLVLSLARIRQTAVLHSIVRAALPAPPEVRRECEALASRLGLRKAPPVKLVSGGMSPLLWCCGPPVILLPASLVEKGREDLLRAVIGHELGHLRRRDPWASWLELVTTLVYWWLPTAWIAVRQIERAADEAADATAAEALGSARGYASSLLRTIEVLNMDPLPLALPGRSLGEREAVQRRLVMLLRGPLVPRLDWKCRLAIVILAVFTLPAAPRPAESQSAESEPAVEAATAVEPSPAVELAPAVAPAPQAEPAPAALPVVVDVELAPVALPAAAAEPELEISVDPTGDLLQIIDSPAGDSGADMEARLRQVEEKIEKLLREVAKLRSSLRQAGPAVAPASSDSVHGSGGVRAVQPRSGDAPNVPRTRVTPPRAVLRGSASPRPDPKARAVPSPATVRSRIYGEAAESYRGAGRAFHAPEVEFEEPGHDLTPEQREKVEALDRAFRERLEKHRKRYEKERREAIQSILEGKDAPSPQPEAPAAN